MLSGSADFFGINHYTSELVTASNGWPWTSGPSCWGGTSQACDNPDYSAGWCPDWKVTASTWLAVAPWPFRKILKWIDYEYDGIPIFVTENGFSSNSTSRDPNRDQIYDPDRAAYYRDYINEMLKAAKIDGVNMMGYGSFQN